jgi:hypothetical protein
MSQLVSEHYGCNISRTTIFSKTLCLRVRIHLYASIRTIVLTDGKANFYILLLHYASYYSITTHLRQGKKVRYTLKCSKIRGLTQCEIGAWGVSYSDQYGK